MTAIIRSIRNEYKKNKVRFLDFVVIALIVGFFVYAALWFYNQGYYPKIPSSPPPQLIILQPGVSTNILSTNAITHLSNDYPHSISDYLNQSPSESFNIGDVVMIKFFDVSGVVVEKKEFPYNPVYDVMYKDHNHQLHVITLEREFLMRPKVGVIRLLEMDLND